jgi:lysosomal acid lipase/cholesteryl ester hydrolase
MQVALVAHSQGTTQTFLALSKGEIPQLGLSISCFVALAPAVYAGPLLKEIQFSLATRLSRRLHHMCFGRILVYLTKVSIHISLS